MRNVVATLVQVVAVVCGLVGLWLLSLWLFAAVVLGGVGWYLAPDKRVSDYR